MMRAFIKFASSICLLFILIIISSCGTAKVDKELEDINNSGLFPELPNIFVEDFTPREFIDNTTTDVSTNVVTPKVRVDVEANILDSNYNLVSNYLFKDTYYYVVVCSEYELDEDCFVFSSSIKVLCYERDNNKIVFNIIVIDDGEYSFDYSDDVRVTSHTFESFEYRIKENYFVELYHNDTMLEAEDGVYDFVVGVENIISPYMSSANIVVKYNDTIYNNYSVLLDNEETFLSLNNTITAIAEGYNKVTIVCDTLSFDFTLFATIAYAETITLSYPTFVMYDEADFIELNLIPDYDYNYIEDNYKIYCDQDVDVVNNKLMLNTYYPTISGTLLYNDVEYDFSISVLKYYIDNVNIKYNNMEIVNNIVYLTSDLSVVEFCFYERNIKVNIDLDDYFFVTFELSDMRKVYSNGGSFVYLNALTSEGFVKITVTHKYTGEKYTFNIYR